MYTSTYQIDTETSSVDMKVAVEDKLTSMGIDFEPVEDLGDGYTHYSLNALDKKALIDFFQWTHYNVDGCPSSFNVEDAEDAIEEI